MDKLSEERIREIADLVGDSRIGGEMRWLATKLLALRAENEKLNTSLLEMAGAEAALECAGAKAVAGLLDDAQAENAKLRAVVDAVRAATPTPA